MQDVEARTASAAQDSGNEVPAEAAYSCPYTAMSAAENPPIDDAVAAAWLRLVAVAELLPPVLDARLQLAGGLTHFEFLVLTRLAEAPSQTLRMSALADATNATLPRLSHVIARMIDRKLVDRMACPEDRRGTNVVLTEAGEAMIRRARPAYTYAVNEHFAQALTAEQVAALDSATQSILAVLDPTNRLQVRQEGLSEVQCLTRRGGDSEAATNR